ncbi:MAG: 5-formyltetrahydrofolate cyclo-ligase [Bowdeniella nasicola]|nr:5-formyltetrahydrofolate cyclo-ligase [Bowdeniella nasicola]
MTTLTALPAFNGLDVEDAKKLLRSTFRSLRADRCAARNGDEQACEQEAEALAAHALQAVGEARTVAAYVSQPGEPDTSRLISALAGRGVRVLLPVLGPGLARAWAYYRGDDDLEVRAPGRPPEPSGPILPAEAIQDAECVITPGLAVDGLGNRLGQGGGWYDRMLQLIDDDIPTFTLLFDHELIRDQLLPAAEFDIPIKAVITPSEWFLLEGSAMNRAALALA